jgi:hypothetical protein
MHCGGVIDPVRDAWHVCHGYKDGLPRAMGGSDAWENLAPGRMKYLWSQRLREFDRTI